MDLSSGSSIHGFTVVNVAELPEIDGTAATLVHNGSGARLLYLANDDNNKSFAIGFRTPPADDTGVFHILEHSVLCGSDRFPVKEPFVDLLKTSMQTFLNAMTFSDKTLYPVASTNEQDLLNLMDVYLDAVFHPQIYRKRAVFEQEGWHLELHANDAASQARADELPPDQTTLSYNGVVFNEMKGALSDANSVLAYELQKAMFPDTCYAFESGGTPEAIPTLTYEGYLDEHRRHYRTDNSYIVLYGNLDVQRALAFIDERYLSPVAREQRELDEERAREGLEPLAARTIARQDPIENLHVERTMDTAPENACAAAGFVIGDAGERVRVMATDILLDALFGSNEAPAKRALLDAGVADDVTAFVADAMAQPFAAVQFNMPHGDAGGRVYEIVRDTVAGIVAQGLDPELLEAALSHAEFQLREHELGLADGVAYAIVALSGWLYDDDAALDYLRYEDAFAQLRGGLGSGYFDDLAHSLFLDNAHIASAQVIPAPGAADSEIDDALAQLSATLGDADRKRIVEEEAMLRALQEAPDAPEAIATLPRLGIDDLDEAPDYPRYALLEGTPIACLRHEVPTRGIAYAYRYFDANRIAFDELPYLTILAQVLGKLPTARHTAAELDTLVQGKLGNLTFYSELFESPDDMSDLSLKFVASSSALSENVAWLADLPREIMLETDFSDTGKIADILAQRKIYLEQLFTNSGHSCAAARARSYYAPAGVVNEQLGNVGYYQFLCDLIAHFDERADELSARLADMACRLFADNGTIVSFAGSDQDLDAFWRARPELDRTADGTCRLTVPDPVCAREGFVIPSNVSFTAVGWDHRLSGKPYTGTWAVVSRALSYDFLWNEVRVKGGAYGVGFQPTRIGNMRFYSYRDPHLDETLARFGMASDWLAGFDPTPESMDGLIVATVAGIDAPVKPRMLIRRQAAEFFCGQTPEERKVIRGQVVETTPQDVRNLAKAVAEVAESPAVCSFGSREILSHAAANLNLVELLGD